MSSPFIGEIRMFAGNFAPVGWALCNGAVISISDNDALFTLIGTTYGGDGHETFALPNLQSRIPIHAGAGFTLGQSGGVENVILTTTQMPSHTHAVLTSTGTQVVGQPLPAGNFLADDTFGSPPNPQPFTYAPYVNDLNQRTLAPGSIQAAGGGQPHDNMVPFVAINFILSLFGVFPTQN